MSTPAPRVSVLMPTYMQGRFIRRALDSLRAQTLAAWELIVVDDGSPDDTSDVLATYHDDPRIRCHHFDTNRGLGAALNFALNDARADLIAYLPSDDVYYPEHLATLVAALETHPDAVAAYSGVRHHYNRGATGQIDGEPLQLVQVLHRRTTDRWIARDELTTDDLDRMYWAKLRARGAFVRTVYQSCEWVDHPDQRHKIIREPLGGINPYRLRYHVSHPLRFHSMQGNVIDEVAQYRRFRDRPDTPPAADGLKILLVGELAYNAERVLALEERGHRLFGLWTPQPYWFNTVGPLPFGHVTDLPQANWREAIRALKPDVIYGLLNWQAVPFVHTVMQSVPDVPFIWHFKEGPFICLEKGIWDELVDLTMHSDGQIYSSPEMRDWFDTIIPGVARNGRNMALDGDLPKRDWLTDTRAPLLSDQDGEVHTVVPGRPIGLHVHVVGDLAKQGIHLHFYGDFTHGQWAEWIPRARALAGKYLHLHPNIGQEQWTAEFSRYDAGWLHWQASENGGDLRRANWDDLNYPARIATLAVAGVPLLQYDNRGHSVATQTLAQERDLGLFFGSIEELAEQLRDRPRMAALRESVWRQRADFTFDAHTDELLAFFRTVIAGFQPHRAHMPTQR